MIVLSSFEWNQHDRSTAILRNLRSAATNRDEYEPHDVVDDEAAIQADLVEERLEAIDAALHRLVSGRYGVCASCGTAVADQRLKALPTTVLCRSCASEASG